MHVWGAISNSQICIVYYRIVKRQYGVYGVANLQFWITMCVCSISEYTYKAWMDGWMDGCIYVFTVHK